MNKQLLPSASDQKFEDMTVMVSDSLITDMVADITTLRARLTEVEGERDTWKDLCGTAERRLKRLAYDALTSLAGTVCTPVEGYILAPQCLSANIREVVKDLTQAQAALAEMTEKARKLGEVIIWTVFKEGHVTLDETYEACEIAKEVTKE